MAKTQKSHSERVLSKVGKRPKAAGEIATQLGYSSHHGVSRTLGQLVKSGEVVKTEKGYAKA